MNEFFNLLHCNKFILIIIYVYYFIIILTSFIKQKYNNNKTYRIIIFCYTSTILKKL